tara:strand:- start:1714 stop:2193 length:480 start_codon:yes stop_codon:yes gene_type:complete
MAKRRTKSKTRKVKRGKNSRKTMKRSRGKKSSRKSRSRSKAKAHNVSNILSSTYGLAGLFKGNEKGYKQQRVGVAPDPYKKKKMTPPPIPKNKKGKKIKSSSKAAKDSFLAGIQSETLSLPKQSKGSWLSHVKKVYEEGKRSQPGYKYKDAMKDAKKTW